MPVINCQNTRHCAVHTKGSPMRGGLDVAKNKNKKKNRNDRQRKNPVQPEGSADEVEFAREPGAADEVIFGREPGAAADEVVFGREPEAAADEVVFDEVIPGTPNAFDAVEFQGAPANRDVEFGEEARAEHRDDRLRDEEDVEAAAEVAPVTDPIGEGREQDGARLDQEEAGDEGSGLGITSIILSVLSFFFVPFLLGSAGIILGIIAGRRGSAMGWWAVGLGAVSVILTAFVAPIAGF